MRKNPVTIFLVTTACLAAVLLFAAGLGGQVASAAKVEARESTKILTSPTPTPNEVPLSEAARTAPLLTGRSAELRGFPVIGVGVVVAVLVCSLAGAGAVLGARRRRSLPEF